MKTIFLYNNLKTFILILFFNNKIITEDSNIIRKFEDKFINIKQEKQEFKKEKINLTPEQKKQQIESIESMFEQQKTQGWQYLKTQLFYWFFNIFKTYKKSISFFTLLVIVFLLLKCFFLYRSIK